MTHPKPAPVQIYDYYETGRSFILTSMTFGGGTGPGTAETLCALRETQTSAPGTNTPLSSIRIWTYCQGRDSFHFSELGLTPKVTSGHDWKVITCQNKRDFKDLRVKCA